MAREPTTSDRPLIALTLLLLLAACAGCDKNKPPPIEPPAAIETTRESAPVENDDDELDKVAPPPAQATAGEVVDRLPRPAPKLSDGVQTATAMPDTSCEELAPDNNFKLARKIDVITHSTTKGEAEQTLELCVFNRWVQRSDPELSQRTGRKHHYVAAFPGNNVSSWTSREISRGDLGLPEEGAKGLAAGWAALIATGVAKWPAVAVVSGRFYGGELGEEIHYLRRGRVLLQKSGRWTWEPLTERAFATLDTTWLQKKCEDATAAQSNLCKTAAERIQRTLAQANMRQRRRKARLAGKDDPTTKRPKSRRNQKKKLPANPLTYTDDPDPHAAWLRDGRQALAQGNSKLAIRNALRVFVACGESSKQATALIAEANKKAKVAAPRVQPMSKGGQLCEPLPDKPPPKDRKP